MGKKEKDIKRQNDNFYKEYNFTRDDKKERLIEDEEDKETEKHKQVEAGFENMLSNMKLRMLEYVTHQGLPLCQKLDDTNIENYISHILNGCPRAITHIDVEDYTEVIMTQPSPGEHLNTLYEIDKIQQDIDEIIKNTITKLGEFDIFKEYINHAYSNNPYKILEESRLFPVLRKRMIKMSGSVEKYNEWVYRVGAYEYRKLEESIK
jgi:hypothetical protein